MRHAAVLLIALTVLLTGCASPSATLPVGVSASVFQNRFDYSLRVLEIKITNDTDATITVARAEFESTRFSEPAVWDRQQDIPAGAARDLKVQLPAPVCDDAQPVDTVSIDFALPDGTRGTAELTPSDEQGRVDTINAEDCLGASVASIVTLTAPDLLQWTPGSSEPAIVEIAVEPTGAEGAATIRDAKGTVLLGLVDDRGAPVSLLPLDLVVDARGAATSIRLAVVPNRCDPHAIEEDKRGTFFPLDVETSDGRSGTIYIAVSDDVRRGLYEFYADYCGLPA